MAFSCKEKCLEIRNSGGTQLHGMGIGPIVLGLPYYLRPTQLG